MFESKLKSESISAHWLEVKQFPMQATRIILIRPFSKASSFNREYNNLKSDLSIALARTRGILEDFSTGTFKPIYRTGEAAKRGNCNIAKSTNKKLNLFIVLKILFANMGKFNQAQTSIYPKEQ